MDLADALGLGERELVSFVGAGGKKTAMSLLVTEGDERGLALGYTTTVHVPPPDLPLVLADPDALATELADADTPVAFARERVSDPERVDEKLRGFAPGVIDDVADRFDWLLVKADGARMREFKAPNPDEPPLPRRSTVVVPVASVRAVGTPLADDRVHRPDRVAAITGRERGEKLSAADVGSVLASPDGGLKDVPSTARVVPLVNKADDPVDRATARRVLAAAFERSDRFDRGLVASLRAGYCEVVRGGTVG